MKKINLYTDGACSGNPGPGGWGAILVFNGTEKEFSGGTKNTTNNQMELLAVIEGLKALKQPCEVHIVSDSKYVIQAIQEWLPNWKKNNWIGSNKKEIKNIERYILKLKSMFAIEIDFKPVENSNNPVSIPLLRGFNFILALII